LSRASIKQFKSWETGYSESSGSTYADQKTRNPDHVRRRNTPQPDNDAITKHLQDLLSPAIYAQSAYSKFGTQRADTQPNIDGRGGVNPFGGKYRQYRS